MTDILILLSHLCIYHFSYTFYFYLEYLKSTLTIVLSAPVFCIHILLINFVFIFISNLDIYFIYDISTSLDSLS